MRLLVIETNRGNKIDGGFRHTVFEKSTMNGRVTTEVISSDKFGMILNEKAWIEDYIKDPEAFKKSTVDQPEQEEQTGEVA